MALSTQPTGRIYIKQWEECRRPCHPSSGPFKFKQCGLSLRITPINPWNVSCIVAFFEIILSKIVEWVKFCVSFAKLLVLLCFPCFDWPHMWFCVKPWLAKLVKSIIQYHKSNRQEISDFVQRYYIFGIHGVQTTNTSWVNLLLGSELIYTKELLKYSLADNCPTLLGKTCRNTTNSLYQALCKPESIKL